MPFSFIEIEESKSRIIAFVFLSIIIFYFLTAYILLTIVENALGLHTYGIKKGLFFLPPPKHTLVVLIIALIAALTHWAISTTNLIQKMVLAVGAMPLDPKDIYHQYFKNIVDEVSVAAGNRHIEAMIIPSPGMNAFSLTGFDRRAIIGLTEGLLSRLSRAQLEAVVAHEAGHIVSGDSLTTTVTCSLSEIYEEGFSKISASLRHIRGRGGLILFLVLIVLGIMNFLSRLLRYFISRQREYRADAVAVRLTRNPLSLAEALKMISGHWRGSGADGEKMESIFIVNPNFNKLDEEEGVMSEAFSTHPPIRKRISILLDMAHMDEKTLEQNLKNFKRASPVAAARFKPTEAEGVKKWLIFEKDKWLGPYLLEDIAKLEGLRPDQWVKLQGQDNAMPAYEDNDLRTLFKKEGAKKSCCPYCATGLEELTYEGAPILRCPYCEGLFVEQNKVTRIFVRKDLQFSEETKRLAQTIINSKKKRILKKTDPKSTWVINCPKCQRRMRRQFFVYSYPVEIDRCMYCAGIWFDKQELEILQYLYENKEKFFDGKYF